MIVAYKPSAHSDPLAPYGAPAVARRPDIDRAAEGYTGHSPYSASGGDAARRMSNPHRGLPPLTSLQHNPVDSRQQAPPPPPSLPPQNSLATSSSYSQPLGQLPEAPRPGHGHDEAMRNWLQTKAEEEKRRQEEEKTKQEGLKLEQRKIEQSMLRDSIQAGIPAPMVPMVFAGMGGSDVAKASLEWAQHYMSQMSLQQPGQSQATLPPAAPSNALELRRDARQMPGPPANPYAAQAPAPAPAPPPPASQNVAPAAGNGIPPSAASHAVPPQSNSFGSPYQQQSQDAQRFRFQPHDPSSGQQRAPQPLSRLNTGGSLAEMQIQQPPPGGMQMPVQAQSHQPHVQGPNSTPQQQNSQQVQQQHNSSPAIYFHHWTPPNTTKESSNPNNVMNNNSNNNSSTKSTHTSPYASHATSHLRHEYVQSPKKRRTGGSAGGSVGDKNSENGTATTSPQDAESPRFEVLRPGDVTGSGARKRGLSNVTSVTNITRADSDRHSSIAPERQGSAGPGERKRTLSGTPKTEVEVGS